MKRLLVRVVFIALRYYLSGSRNTLLPLVVFIFPLVVLVYLPVALVYSLVVLVFLLVVLVCPLVVSVCPLVTTRLAIRLSTRSTRSTICRSFYN